MRGKLRWLCFSLDRRLQGLLNLDTLPVTSPASTERTCACSGILGQLTDPACRPGRATGAAWRCLKETAKVTPWQSTTQSVGSAASSSSRQSRTEARPADQSALNSGFPRPRLPPRDVLLHPVVHEGDGKEQFRTRAGGEVADGGGRDVAAPGIFDRQRNPQRLRQVTHYSGLG